MRAFVFKSNSEFLAKFEIQNEQTLPEELKKFLVSHPMVPKFSYLEVEGKTLTILNLDPLQLVSGIVREEQSNPRNKEQNERGEVMSTSIEEIVIEEKNITNRKKVLLYLLSIPALFLIGLAIIIFYIQPPETKRRVSEASDNIVSKKNVSTPNYGSPESQFLKFQTERMGPNYDIVNVVINLYKVDGEQAFYKGFYTFKIRGTTRTDTGFFHAAFKNGRFIGWNPDR